MLFEWLLFQWLRQRLECTRWLGLQCLPSGYARSFWVVCADILRLRCVFRCMDFAGGLLLMGLRNGPAACPDDGKCPLPVTKPILSAGGALARRR